MVGNFLENVIDLVAIIFLGLPDGWLDVSDFYENF